MDRLFLNANVLFSAAYREDSGLLRLWRVSKARLLTSAYAAEEARRNLAPDAIARLESLLDKTDLVTEAPGEPLPEALHLSEKDRPILQAAISARATHLLTGDIRDFGRLFGKRIRGVLVQTPGDFLRGQTMG